MTDFLSGVSLALCAKSPEKKPGNYPTKVRQTVLKSPGEKPVGGAFHRLTGSRNEAWAVPEPIVGSILGTQKAEAPSHFEGATYNSLGNMNLDNSRGGTRTRDPGIMSAVL